MIETLTIITLSVLFLILFRPGKTPPLASPLVIERAGQYRITMAPQLNLAQPFIEAVALRMEAVQNVEGEPGCIFEVRDRQVTPKGSDFYLLSIAQRDGMLYFDAAHPSLEGGKGGVPDSQGQDCALIDAVQHVADKRGIIVSLHKA